MVAREARASKRIAFSEYTSCTAASIATVNRQGFGTQRAELRRRFWLVSGLAERRRLSYNLKQVANSSKSSQPLFGSLFAPRPLTHSAANGCFPSLLAVHRPLLRTRPRPHFSSYRPHSPSSVVHRSLSFSFGPARLCGTVSLSLVALPRRHGGNRRSGPA